MTDTYDEGSEPHDHAGQDETLIPGEAVHEPPSDYEFADEQGAVTADEHTEEHSPLPSETKSARRSPLLPVAAAIGGVMLLGTVAWWQLGGSSSPSQPANEVSSMAIPPLAAPVTASNPTNAALPAPAALPVAPKTSEAAVTATTDSAPVSALPAAAVPAATAPAAPAPPLPVAASSSAVPAPASPPAGAEDQRIDALAARIDTLQKELDQASTQLGQMTNAIAASGVAAAPAGKDMQDRLDKLEQQIAELRHAPAAPSAPADMVIAETHPAPIARKHVQPHKTATHKAKKKAPAAEASAPVTHWVLRAASPGQAWVSASATSTDLKQLQVGDTLPGIGRVTAIRNEGESWIVQGTKGKIQ